ncbi:MAG: response regulator [Erythrobacter sp.]
MSPPCVLVTEDEWIIGADLCETVQEAGFQIEGPHRDISSAMLAFQKHKPDVAILDVQLDDGVVYALAQKLADEQVPIIFHSGRFSREEVSEVFPNAMTLLKPCPPADVIAAVKQVLQPA